MEQITHPDPVGYKSKTQFKLEIPADLVFGQQKKYREEAEKTMSHYVPVLDTPEMQRVRENQKNFSTVSRNWE